jgi:hypothetical protein
LVDITIRNPLGGTTALLDIEVYNDRIIHFPSGQIVRGQYTLTGLPLADCAAAGPFAMTITPLGLSGAVCKTDASPSMTASFV